VVGMEGQGNNGSGINTILSLYKYILDSLGGDIRVKCEEVKLPPPMWPGYEARGQQNILSVSTAFMACLTVL